MRTSDYGSIHEGNQNGMVVAGEGGPTRGTQPAKSEESIIIASDRDHQNLSVNPTESAPPLTIPNIYYQTNSQGLIFASIAPILTSSPNHRQPMIEKQSINGKEFWVEVEPYHVERDNPRTIPTEYFTARYYLQDPTSSAGAAGEVIAEKDGQPKLFESPVAALQYANEKLIEIIHRV